MNCAGIIYDQSQHYLDHLAPFCSLLKWPLILCEPDLADLARRYYPDLEIIETDLLDLTLPPKLVSCETRPLLQAAFPHWKGTNFWLPHGNSDKGWKSAFFESTLQSKDIALVYGQKMVDFMNAKHLAPIFFRIGNFRAHYWQKHKTFYHDLLSVPPKTFLYAPTWNDAEQNGSFWQAFPHLSQNLPDSTHLLIKLHPNTLRQHEIELEILKGRLDKKKNIHFLNDFPPIYPLLSQCDAYIGDMSSIGYDFLYFNRPMYFLNPQNRNSAADPGLYLFQCGEEIDPKQFFFKSSHEILYTRSQIYSYTFDPTPDWQELATRLAST